MKRQMQSIRFQSRNDFSVCMISQTPLMTMARAASFVLFIATVLQVSTLGLIAAPLNFQVLCDKKRFDVERGTTVSTKVSKEQWGYGVTIENKTFKPQDNLEVEYRQYVLDDVATGKPKLKSYPAKTTIAALPSGGKFKFDTTPVDIEKEEMKANYSRAGKEKVKDTLSGLWLRIMKDGQMIYEFQSPPDLKNKAKWE
jgi:hypothetical protein